MEIENYNYFRSRVRDVQVINTSFSKSFLSVSKSALHP